METLAAACQSAYWKLSLLSQLSQSVSESVHLHQMWPKAGPQSCTQRVIREAVLCHLLWKPIPPSVLLSFYVSCIYNAPAPSSASFKTWLCCYWFPPGWRRPLWVRSCDLDLQPVLRRPASGRALNSQTGIYVTSPSSNMPTLCWPSFKCDI